MAIPVTRVSDNEIKVNGKTVHIENHTIVNVSHLTFEEIKVAADFVSAMKKSNIKSTVQ